MNISNAARFLRKVELRGDCLIWTGAINPAGYARFWLNGGARQAHQVAYQAKNGLIPGGLELDHLCRNRACVNVDHLEAVTAQINQLRGYGVSGINARRTECIRGHVFDEANTYVNPIGQRKCRICQKVGQRRRRAGRANE